MSTQLNIGVAARIGTYSDAVTVPENARWLITAGTPGLPEEGPLPTDFTEQAVLAWENVLRILAQADMGVEDIVKVTQTLIRRSDLDAYRPVRSKYLGSLRPASMLVFVDGLIWPEILIELEIVAAKAR